MPQASDGLSEGGFCFFEESIIEELIRFKYRFIHSFSSFLFLFCGSRCKI